MAKKIFKYVFPNNYYPGAPLKDRTVKGFKLNQDQVEDLLTAHNLGQLTVLGEDWNDEGIDYRGCAVQIVYNEPQTLGATGVNPGLAAWFDHTYRSDWTVDQMIEEMVKADII